MDYLFVNTTELDLLSELPYIQRVAYLMGIRPFMDRQSLVVGIKRKISYQSLREVLYVAPIAGVQTGSPSKAQVRRAIQGLERAGLIEIQSTDKQLIFKCLLADTDKFISNKAITRPTYEADTRPSQQKPVISSKKVFHNTQADTAKSLQAVIPHNSVNNYVCVSARFEKFWASYPEKKNKQAALQTFQKINPDEILFSKIIKALNAQIQNHEQRIEMGYWVPKWKYPANWLAQNCWEDELTEIKAKEIGNETNSKNREPNEAKDFFWESCQFGLNEEPTKNHVIE